MSTPQAKAAPAASASPTAAGGGKKFVVLGAAALLLAGGGVVAYRQLRPAAHEEKTPARPAVKLDAGVVTIEPFVLNLSDPAGDRYFRLSVRLVLDQSAIAARANGGLAQVKLRDRILSILAKKRAAEITTVEGKERLRMELQQAAEGLLDSPPFHDPATDPAPAHVSEVFFTEFLVQ